MPSFCLFRSYFMALQDPRPGKWLLFRIWAGIGLQSFGGGASTTFLIQRTFIEKHTWLSMEEFTYLWNLCVLTKESGDNLKTWPG